MTSRPDLSRGDIVVARIRVWEGESEHRGHNRIAERPGRVLEAYPAFVTILVQRGKEVVRESVDYRDIVAVEPEGVTAPPMPSRGTTSRAYVEREGIPLESPPAESVREPEKTAGEEVVALYKAGATYAEISARTGLGYSAISRHVAVAEAKGEVVKRGKGPRPGSAQTIAGLERKIAALEKRLERLEGRHA